MRGSAEQQKSEPVKNGDRGEPGNGNIKFLAIVLVVAVLFFAREVFIPLVLAMLLAFLLAPLVTRLRRWGLWRIPSVISIVLLAFILIGIIGMFLASQLGDLAHKLPGYEQNVRQKLQSIRSSGSGVVNRVSKTVNNVSGDLTVRQKAPSGQEGEEKPVPVEIRRSAFSPLEVVQKMLGSLLSIGFTALIVIVFVIFMLIQQEDLRNRLIKLAGARRLDVTTKVLDDAADRVSRYLLAQLIVNVVYGALAGLAVYLIGVPNPLMWGMLAALLRYIPYLGIWVAALMPALVAFAVEPGWVKLPLIFGIYFGIDLLMYNLAEPVLYGNSTGVSPLAILVAAVFWTWLWGPVGLLLATPLTVCVVVIGRHVPNLEFLSIMLSDEPALKPQTRFYQRMLAMDLDEATEIAEEFLKGKSLEDLYDGLIIPALSLAEEDRHRGKLSDKRQQFIFRNTRILLEDIAERSDELIARNGSQQMQDGNPSENPGNACTVEASVLCVPARDEADELAAFMLAQLLQKSGIGARPVPAASLAIDAVGRLSQDKAKIACVFAVPPFGYMHARYLCRRLQERFKNLKLIAGILTERDVQELKLRHPTIAADQLASSLKEVVAAVRTALSLENTAAASTG